MPKFTDKKNYDPVNSLRGPGSYNTEVNWLQSRRQVFRKIYDDNKSAELSLRKEFIPGPGYYNSNKKTLLVQSK